MIPGTWSQASMVLLAGVVTLGFVRLAWPRRRNRRRRDVLGTPDRRCQRNSVESVP